MTSNLSQVACSEARSGGSRISRRGACTRWGGGVDLRHRCVLVKMYAKMKELGSIGSVCPSRPLDPPMAREGAQGHDTLSCIQSVLLHQLGQKGLASLFWYRRILGDKWRNFEGRLSMCAFTYGWQLTYHKHLSISLMKVWTWYSLALSRR